MRFAAITMLMLFSTQSWAAPAAWYQWRSKLNGDLVCSQTSPGAGWEKFIGPFKDAHCEYLLRR